MSGNLISLKAWDGEQFQRFPFQGYGQQQAFILAKVVNLGRGTEQQSTRPVQTSALQSRCSGAVHLFIELS